MKTLSFSSLCKRAVAFFALIAGLCVSIHAETRWTKSMFYSSRTVVSSTDELVPGTMAPMFLMARFEDHHFHFAIRTYLGAPLPTPLQITYTIYGGDNPYYTGTTTVNEATYVEELEGNVFNGPTGMWTKLELVQGAVIPYYSITAITVTYHLIAEDGPLYSMYFDNAPLWIDSSLYETLERSGLKDPAQTLIIRKYVTYV